MNMNLPEEKMQEIKNNIITDYSIIEEFDVNDNTYKGALGIEIGDDQMFIIWMDSAEILPAEEEEVFKTVSKQITNIYISTKDNIYLVVECGDCKSQFKLNTNNTEFDVNIYKLQM